jgi:tetratricopeptide (TPR) repeat protein
MARAEQKLDDLPAARRHVGQALEIYCEDDRLRLQLIQLGAALSMALQDWDEAFAGSQNAVALARKLWRPDDVLAAIDLSGALRALGIFCGLLKSRSRLDWARTLLSEAAQLARSSTDETQTPSWWLATTISDLAGVERALGDTSSAHAHYSEAVSMARAITPFVDAPDWQSVLEMVTGLAEVEADLANFARARTLYAEAVDIARRAVTNSEGDEARHALSHALARQVQISTVLGDAAVQPTDADGAVAESSENHR